MAIKRRESIQSAKAPAVYATAGASDAGDADIDGTTGSEITESELASNLLLITRSFFRLVYSIALTC